MLRFQYLLLLVLSLSAATLVRADPLPGIWKGKLHRRVVYQTAAHQAIYSEDLNLTLLVGEKEVSGNGVAHLFDPTISRPRFDRRYAQWSTSYEPHDFGVLVKGSRTDEGNWLRITLTPIPPVKAHFFFHDIDGSTRVLLDVPQLISQSIPWTESTIGQFVRHLNLSPNEGLELPVDLAYFGENVLGAEFNAEGGFKKVETPARILPSWVILVGLLAYLGLILPGLMNDPCSARLVSMMGTILGSLDALQGLGLAEIARLARVAGVAASVLLWVLELSRLQKEGKTTRQLALSAVVDLAAWAASAYGTMDAMDASITAASSLGPKCAVVMAVLSAAIITYGISFAAVAAKNIKVKIR